MKDNEEIIYFEVTSFLSITSMEINLKQSIQTRLQHGSPWFQELLFESLLQLYELYFHSMITVIKKNG